MLKEFLEQQRRKYIEEYAKKWAEKFDSELFNSPEMMELDNLLHEVTKD